MVEVASVLFPVLALAVIFTFVLALRYLAYLERRAYYDALARRPDLPLEGRGAPDASRHARRRLAASAIAGRRDHGGRRRPVLVRLLTIGVGPWLLGGLIPLFVGLAVILFALAPGAGE